MPMDVFDLRGRAPASRDTDLLCRVIRTACGLSIALAVGIVAWLLSSRT